MQIKLWDCMNCYYILKIRMFGSFFSCLYPSCSWTFAVLIFFYNWISCKNGPIFWIKNLFWRWTYFYNMSCYLLYLITLREYFSIIFQVWNMKNQTIRSFRNERKFYTYTTVSRTSQIFVSDKLAQSYL